MPSSLPDSNTPGRPQAASTAQRGQKRTGGFRTRTRAGAAVTGVGPLAGIAYAEWDLPTAAARVGEGLSADILITVQQRLGLDQKGLAHVLGVSASTVGRRKPGERLSPGVSERALRVARLAEVAARVLGGPAEALGWMKEPNVALGDVTPIEMARTEPGARLVERLLGEIEYGLPL